MANLKLLLRREQKGMTQEQVAGKAKCNRITYLRAENNGDVPSLKTAIGIAKTLDIKTVDELEDAFFNQNVQIRTLETSK